MTAFLRVARSFAELEKTRSRLEMVRILADLFQRLKADEIQPAVYPLAGAPRSFLRRAGLRHQRKTDDARRRAVLQEAAGGDRTVVSGSAIMDWSRRNCCAENEA